MTTSLHTTTNAAHTSMVAEALAAGLSMDEIELAVDARDEHDLLCHVHPTEEERALHRVDECDGACMRFRRFRTR